MSFKYTKSRRNSNTFSKMSNSEKSFNNSDMQDGSGNRMSFMQMNGRKVLHPPENWSGPTPSSECELFVRHIPKELPDNKLIKAFSRFGSLYELRVPMDFSHKNRGFGYVKYTNENDAACAMEVLSHYFIKPGVKLEVLQSYGKSRLFIGNLPKNLSDDDLDRKLRGFFPSMVKVSSRGGYPKKKPIGKRDECVIGNDTGRDFYYAIIEFASHMEALDAKKSVTTGIIRLWNRDLKVAWAHNDTENKSATTLFVRNVDLSIGSGMLNDILMQHVPRDQIKRVSRVRTTAFLSFTNHEAAEQVLRDLQGAYLNGQRISVEWARPSSQESIHHLCNTDFDATLRLKCIANYWQIPIIIFGTYFQLEGLQYATVVLRNDKFITRALFCAIRTIELTDIHSRLCEVANSLIEYIGTFPDYNYVFYVEKDSAHLLGIITHGETIHFTAASNIPSCFAINVLELIDISCAIAALATIPEEGLLKLYYDSFHTKPFGSFIPNLIVYGHRIFGTILPKYRNRQPLKYNLNDTQIILALCYLNTGTNLSPPNRAYSATPVTSFLTSYQGLSYMELKLLPIKLAQSRSYNKNILSQVIFDGNQKVIVKVPSNISQVQHVGASYQYSIKDSTNDIVQHMAQVPLATPPIVCGEYNGNVFKIDNRYEHQPLTVVPYIPQVLN